MDRPSPHYPTAATRFHLSNCWKGRATERSPTAQFHLAKARQAQSQVEQKIRMMILIVSTAVHKVHHQYMKLEQKILVMASLELATGCLAQHQRHLHFTRRSLLFYLFFAV